MQYFGNCGLQPHSGSSIQVRRDPKLPMLKVCYGEISIFKYLISVFFLKSLNAWAIFSYLHK